MSRREPDLIELIELIYSAGLDPSAWGKVTDRLGTALPEAAVAFQVVGNNSVHFSSANWEAGALESYAEYFVGASPWLAVHRKARPGIPYHADETCPSSTFSDTEFFNDWIRPYKVGCGATAVKLLNDSDCFATLSMNYEERRTDRMKQPVAHLFSRLVPHLGRAIEMNRRLARSDVLARSLEGLLDAIARPVFLLTPDCRVADMNGRAELAVRRNQGVRIGPHGHLLLGRTDETARLHRLVAETASPDEMRPSSPRGLLTFTAPESPGPNLLFVFPLIASSHQPVLRTLQGMGRQVLAIAHLGQDTVLPDADRLAAAFGFTAAESRIVAALVAGQRLADCAEQTNKSIHTVRVQLRNAMAKASCRTQADLVRAVLTALHHPS